MGATIVNMRHWLWTHPKGENQNQSFFEDKIWQKKPTHSYISFNLLQCNLYFIKHCFLPHFEAVQKKNSLPLIFFSFIFSLLFWIECVWLTSIFFVILKFLSTRASPAFFAWCAITAQLKRQTFSSKSSFKS